MVNLSLLWAAWLSSAGSGRRTGFGALMGDVQMCEQAERTCEEAVRKSEEAVGTSE